MTIQTVVSAFAHDAKFQTMLVLIALDFVFGVLAAVQNGTFRGSYVAQFLHDDAIKKVGGWFLFYAGDKLSHNASIVGPIDLGDAAMAAFIAATAALAFSIVSSANDLGVGVPGFAGAGEHQPLPPGGADERYYSPDRRDRPGYERRAA